jgi:hypothetical protein
VGIVDEGAVVPRLGLLGVADEAVGVIPVVQGGGAACAWPKGVDDAFFQLLS